MRKKWLQAGPFLMAAAFSLFGIMPAAGAVRLPAGLFVEDQSLSGFTREEAKQAAEDMLLAAVPPQTATA